MASQFDLNKPARSVYKQIKKNNKLKDKKKKVKITEVSKNNHPNGQISSIKSNNKRNKLNKPYLYSNINDSILWSDNAFEWLIHPITKNEFSKKYWEKQALYIPRDHNGYYSHLFSLNKFDQIITEHDLYYNENIDVTSYKDGVKELHNPNGKVFSPVLWEYFNEGCSVRFLNPAKFSRAVWSLNAGLQEYFSSFVGCNMYLTPAYSQGFAPHYDDIDAFVLQIEGYKHWKVYAPFSNDLTMPLKSSVDFNETSTFTPEYWRNPILEVCLKPGDLLYMPRGFVHQASTIPPNKNDSASHSLHLTLSVCQSSTWGQTIEKGFLHALRTLMHTDVEFRKSLPPGHLNYIGQMFEGKDAVFGVDYENNRKQFKATISTLMNRVCETMCPDTAVDFMALSRYIPESLPPYLATKQEKLSTIHSFHQSTDVCSKVLMGESLFPNLTLRTRIKLVRYGSHRIVTPDTCSFEKDIKEIMVTPPALQNDFMENECPSYYMVYHNLENGLNYKEKPIQSFAITPEVCLVIKYLMKTYPKYIPISKLPLSEEREKIDVALSLFEKGLIKLHCKPKPDKKVRKKNSLIIIE